jgi:hypothetical protein
MPMLPAVEFIKTVLCPDRLGIEPLQLLLSFFAHRGEGLTVHLQLSPLLLPAREVVGEEALFQAVERGEVALRETAHQLARTAQLVVCLVRCRLARSACRTRLHCRYCRIK